MQMVFGRRQKIGEVLSAKPAKVNALLLKKLG